VSTLTLDAYEERLLVLPEEYKECRVEGHTWQRIGKWHLYSEQVVGRKMVRHIAKHYTCRRCAKGRKFVYVVRTSAGSDYIERVGGPRYEDPPGYAVRGTPADANARDILLQADFAENYTWEVT